MSSKKSLPPRYMLYLMTAPLANFITCKKIPLTQLKKKALQIFEKCLYCPLKIERLLKNEKSVLFTHFKLDS